MCGAVTGLEHYQEQCSFLTVMYDSFSLGRTDNDGLGLGVTGRRVECKTVDRICRVQ